jgi:hypothetical protein
VKQIRANRTNHTGKTTTAQHVTTLIKEIPVKNSVSLITAKHTNMTVCSFQVALYFKLVFWIKTATEVS